MRLVVGALVLAALSVAGVAAAVVAPGGGSSSEARATTVRVTVTASEFRFVLSRRSVPVGTTVIFKVTNKGKISHNFRIVGKTTPTLSPGRSATLTVKFTKKGRFTYLCTLPGHASAGMKGTFSVGVAAVTPPPATTTAPTTTTTTTTTPTGTVGNASTTVQVGMFEFRFDLSQTTVPSGQVTFVITNKGTDTHTFSLVGVKAGAFLSPGQSETWTVALPPGSYGYRCDVSGHAERGMEGQLTVTS